MEIEKEKKTNLGPSFESFFLALEFFATITTVIRERRVIETGFSL